MAVFNVATGSISLEDCCNYNLACSLISEWQSEKPIPLLVDLICGISGTTQTSSYEIAEISPDITT